MAAEFGDELLPKSRAVSWDDALGYDAPEDLEARFKLLYSTPLESSL